MEILCGRQPCRRPAGSGARSENHRGLTATGYLATAKAVMKMLSVDAGPARLPNTNPTKAQVNKLRGKLDAFGVFDSVPS